MEREHCKKCLLLEAGERITYQEIIKYISSLDKSELIDEEEAERRLNYCKNCDNLISGMCLKCGCYVEVRARLKNSHCPNVDFKQW